MRTALLSEVADIYTGTAPASTAPGPRSLFIQIKDLDAERRALVSAAQPIVKRATAAQPGDVLMAARGERGVTVLADQELYGAYPSLDVYLIRPQADRLEASYLMAFLNQIPVSAGLRSSTAGSLVSRIPKPALDHLLLPLPDLHKQRAIGQLAAAAQAEQALATRLHKAQQHLRERQLAAAFASLN